VIVRETVPAALAGERLDRIVSIIADVSRSQSSALVAGGGALVDGRECLSGKLRLTEGQEIAVDLARIPEEELPAAEDGIEFRLVYEDAHLAVIDKPAGLVVHPAPGHRSGTLVNGLLRRWPSIAAVGEPRRPGVVHRLDAGTTGLMLVALTPDAHAALVSLLAAHDVVREYLAVAWGHFESSSTVVDAPIGRDPRDPLRMAVVRDGKWARTRLSVEREWSDPPASLVRCSLETGRTHQIRVHLAATGHPVAGDALYGGARSGLSLPRPMLHAERLSLVHPFLHEEMSWHSPVPDDMGSLIGGWDASGS